MSNYKQIEIAIESLLQAQKFYEASNFICSVILGGAGQRILHDLCSTEGIEPVVETIGNFNGHGKNRVHGLITNCYNKLKHADRDANDDVFVSSDEARVLLTVAATDLLRLNTTKSVEILNFIKFIERLKKDSQ